jgi:hypothetical protein
MLAKMYKKVEPLVKTEQLKISALKDYAYSKDVTRAMLSYEEIAQACKIYPIYFAKDEVGVMPMAILGIDDKNLFLDSKNNWEENAYIPAVVKAYPLGMAKTGDKKDAYTVVYDSEYDGLNKKDSKEVINKDGELTEFGQKMVDFLQNIQGSLNKTQEALNILDEYKLLKFSSLEITINKKEYKIEGVGTIDEEALSKLEDDKILNLVKKGIYRIIDAHFISLNNIHTLAQRISK